MIQITVHETGAGTVWDLVVTDRRGIPARTTSRPDERQSPEVALKAACECALKTIREVREVTT